MDDSFNLKMCFIQPFMVYLYFGVYIWDCSSCFTLSMECNFCKFLLHGLLISTLLFCGGLYCDCFKAVYVIIIIILYYYNPFTFTFCHPTGQISALTEQQIKEEYQNQLFIATNSTHRHGNTLWFFTTDSSIWHIA